MANDTPPVSPVESIPSPEQIRDRLCMIAREQLLLRSLLKVSQQKRDFQPATTSKQGGRVEHLS